MEKKIKIDKYHGSVRVGIRYLQETGLWDSDFVKVIAEKGRIIIEAVPNEEGGEEE